MCTYNKYPIIDPKLYEYYSRRICSLLNPLQWLGKLFNSKNSDFGRIAFRNLNLVSAAPQHTRTHIHT